MTKYAPHTATSAVARALAYVGKAYPVGMCQKWTNEIFGTGAVGDWDGDRDADAVDGWKKALAKGKVVKAASIKSLDDIPAGRMLYWSGGSRGFGHAAVSIGNGQIASTDAPTSGRVGKVAIDWVRQRWGLTFLGYVEVEGNGYTLADKGSTATKTVAQLAAEVIAGKWGNDPDRSRKLKAAGYDPNAVQTEVNRQASKPKGKSVATLAAEVIAGKWGNDPERSRKLKAAGYDPKAVQAEVNRRLR